MAFAVARPHLNYGPSRPGVSAPPSSVPWLATRTAPSPIVYSPIMTAKHRESTGSNQAARARKRLRTKAWRVVTGTARINRLVIRCLTVESRVDVDLGCCTEAEPASGAVIRVKCAPCRLAPGRSPTPSFSISGMFNNVEHAIRMNAWRPYPPRLQRQSNTNSTDMGSVYLAT